MGNDSNVGSLVFWLLVVIALICGLLYLKNPSYFNWNLNVVSSNSGVKNISSISRYSTYESIRVASPSTTVAETSTGRRTIVSDKFVRKLDKDGNIVVLGKDGSIYDVKKGSVLVSGMVITVDDDSYDVYNIDSPAKSVSSN